MAVANIIRPVKFNSEEQRYEQKYIAPNPITGSMELRTKIIEDTEFGHISETAISTFQQSYIVEDISDQIIPLKLEYSPSSPYRIGTLNVFYNGLNITNNIEEENSYSFKIPSAYREIIHTNDKLLIVYFKLNG